MDGSACILIEAARDTYMHICQHMRLKGVSLWSGRVALAVSSPTGEQ